MENKNASWIIALILAACLIPAASALQANLEIDLSNRNVLVNSPQEMINKGLTQIWTDSISRNEPIDELWLLSKDTNGKEQLWRFYEQNGQLIGQVIN